MFCTSKGNHKISLSLLFYRLTRAMPCMVCCSLLTILDLLCWTHSTMSVSCMGEPYSKRGLSCQMEGNNPLLRIANFNLANETQHAASFICARARYPLMFNFLPTRNPQLLQSCFLSSQRSTCTVAWGYFTSDMMASQAGQRPHQQRTQSHSTQPGRAERVQGG